MHAYIAKSAGIGEGGGFGNYVSIYNNAVIGKSPMRAAKCAVTREQRLPPAAFLFFRGSSALC